MMLTKEIFSRRASRRLQLLIKSRSISTFPPLPPFEQWRAKFTPPHSSGRLLVKNENTAGIIAQAMIDSIPHSVKRDKKDTVVIEAFPGAGVLSRALLSLKDSGISKLILLEPSKRFDEVLKPLQDVDPRVRVLPLNGFEWSTYHELEQLGLLNPSLNVPWDQGVNENIHFISHIPLAVLGDQVVAQFYRSIPEKSWIFKYGRVPMSFLLHERLWERIHAIPNSRSRCKLSVIAEATAHTHSLVPRDKMIPFDEHFFPSPVINPEKYKTLLSRRKTTPLIPMTSIPLEKPHIEPGTLDQWDYVLRRLFVLQKTPLSKAMSSLAPGASNLLKTLTIPASEDKFVDVSQEVRTLSVEDWANLVDAFIEWPFAPQDLGITDGIFRDIERD